MDDKMALISEAGESGESGESGEVGKAGEAGETAARGETGMLEGKPLVLEAEYEQESEPQSQNQMVESQHQPQQRQEEEVDDPPPPPLPTPQNMAQHRLFVPFIGGAFLLSLNAGSLTACFLFGESRQPVGHVTGPITKVTRLAELSEQK